MPQPPDLTKRKRWRRVIVALLVLGLICVSCSLNLLPRILGRGSVMRVHMYWNALLPALELPAGEVWPIPVGKEIIDPRTGAVLHEVDWLSNGGYFNLPVSDEPGSYYREVYSQGKRGDIRSRRVFDPSALTYRDVPPSPFRDFEAGSNVLTKENADGSVAWTKTLDFDLGYYDPVRAGDRYIVYTGHGERDVEYGLAALDAETGDLLWKVQRNAGALYGTSKLIFGYEASAIGGSQISHRLVGLSPSDGSELFRLDLPDGAYLRKFEPFADLVGACVEFRGANGGELTILLNGDGMELFRLNESVIAAQKVDGDYIFLTSNRTIRLNSAGSTIWETSESGTEYSLSGSLLALPGGDLLVLTYNGRTASGERVTRLNGTDGDVRWIARHCGGISVSHSAYLHIAHLELRGDWVYVIAQQSAGHTITVLDLESGWEKRRWYYSIAFD